VFIYLEKGVIQIINLGKKSVVFLGIVSYSVELPSIDYIFNYRHAEFYNNYLNY